MNSIIGHIERLLLQHDCVIIPDFGGFVLQSVPAMYLGEEHSFTPACKEIVFNPTLTHNDGLLVESYMQEHSVDFNKALQLVQKGVSGMKEALGDYSELQFGSIGFFVKENEHLIFMPGKSSVVLFSTRSYGLPVFHYLPLSARGRVAVTPAAITANEVSSPVKTDKRGKNIIYNIPVTRTFLRAVAATAAAILLFLLISTPVSDVNKASYSASFVPQEIMPKKTPDDIVSAAFSVSTNDDLAYNDAAALSGETEATTASSTSANLSTEGSTSTKPSTEMSSSTKSSSTKSPTANSSEAKSSAAKTNTAKHTSTGAEGTKYYVQIASFKSKVHAQKYIKQLKGASEAGTANVLVSGGRARVVLQSFSTEREAQSFLDKLHKNPKHKQAWIYVAEN